MTKILLVLCGIASGVALAVILSTDITDGHKISRTPVRRAHAETTRPGSLLVPSGDTSLSAPVATDSNRSASEQALAVALTERSNAIASHYAESIDPVWSQRLLAELEANLKPRIKDGQCAIVDISCRRSTCLVKLQWPNYPVATTHYGSLIGASEDCREELVLPPPQDPALAYEATLIVRCSG